MDKIEYLGNSKLQHGSDNNRIYVMKFNFEDNTALFDRIDKLCNEYDYTKIIIKAARNYSAQFIARGYKIEADIPNYYNGRDNCIFLSKFLSEERSKVENIEEIQDVIAKSKEKRTVSNIPELPESFSIKNLNKKDTDMMANIYRTVFKTYPFPIFDANYLAKTMDDNVEYAGIFHNNTLVSLASAEKNAEDQCAEMTDFATLQDHRGNNFALVLLDYLEKSVFNHGYKVLYTIARSLSYGMNITFKKKGYEYTGTLINNTNIAGKIESMNVWYKNLELSSHLMKIFTAKKLSKNMDEEK